MTESDELRPMRWHAGALELLDQRALPQRNSYVRCTDAAEVAAAIRSMVVRGAPAIGITAAYGVVLAARACYAEKGERWGACLTQDLEMLRQARPTAVNLAWAIERMAQLAQRLGPGDPEPALLDQALAMHESDVTANRDLGGHGAELIQAGSAVLTHCNAGALATGGYGTALGVIRSAWQQGRLQRVYADETRPWLQGARLTAWELLRDDIPVTLLAEGAAAWLMRSGSLQWVIVGADRIAANGDVANKIGTYALAVAARSHGIGFMVAAPTSTIDLAAASGQDIPIEHRDATEVLCFADQMVAAPGADAWNPVFDVTPAELVDAIVTERGVLRNPDRGSMHALMRQEQSHG